jgi:glycogen phosphorylase
MMNGRFDIGLSFFRLIMMPLRIDKTIKRSNTCMHPDLAEYGPVRFHSDPNALYDRHLVFDYAIDPDLATPRERYEAVARSLRDVLALRWLRTKKTHYRLDPKRAYYLSMEFLIGRSLASNVSNLLLDPAMLEACREKNVDWYELLDQEPDAGLGNGGLGRLAACFVESMATMDLPAMGYGLRYEYGIFKQSIRDGWQNEKPDNWLRRPDPWEVVRLDHMVEVNLACSFEIRGGTLAPVPGKPSTLLGIPFDRPVVGYGGRTINTLRLWAAGAPESFHFHQFSHGDFVGAVTETLAAESITRVLYPDDSTALGQELRFLQEYFLCACSIHDIIRRFRANNTDWNLLPEKAAVQLNDTHPTVSIAELMRILLDDAKLGWDQAWGITQRTFGYTNHTLLPEALERWPVSWFEDILPRQLEIIYEINRRFLDQVRGRYPGDEGRVVRMSLIEEGSSDKVRMANLAIVGSHSTNGVAAIHTELLKSQVVPDFAQMFPERFNNKTNGVTPRRWLLVANPALAEVITKAIGDEWINDFSQIYRLKPLADDAAFRWAFQGAKRRAKLRFIEWLRVTTGQTVDPDSIFDSQIKRIHEYKRQLLNALHIIILHNRLRENPNLETPPRTFFFAGKAAPAYHLAKLIIKFINNISAAVDADPHTRGRLKVIFLPDYSVSVAERLIPASDVSEQISTAGYEASGTSNMKFMMNGALTIGTRDGATVEMAEEAGEENMFLFGLNAPQVEQTRGWYNPHWHYENEPETRAALDLISSGYFSPGEPGVFNPILDVLLAKGDHYMHLADLRSYSEAHARLGEFYRNPDTWARTAILNVGSSGKFSSDRTIAEYASEIWNVDPCPTIESAKAADGAS